MLEKVHEILHFWFGDDKTNPLANLQLWWTKSPEFDAEIKQRFEPTLQYVTEGKLDMWLEQPHTCLAYIILTDQFPRNMYRDDPLSFAYDKFALSAAEKGRENKFDKELTLIERQFFYMPFEHSEILSNQKLCLALMQQLVDEAHEQPPVMLQTMQQAFDYAQKHYDIIQNFGRFPHRNAILDRESTQEELLFLSLPGSRF